MTEFNRRKFLESSVASVATVAAVATLAAEPSRNLRRLNSVIGGLLVDWFTLSGVVLAKKKQRLRLPAAGQW